MLFNVTKDPNEKTNVAAQFPERVKELTALLKAEKAKDNDALPK
jgi:hypothetical protein